MTAVPTAFRPPAPERPLDWPEDFGTRFSVCIDTEEEFDWHAPLSRDQCGVTAIAALPAMHAWFADRGVPLIYLVDHPVAATPSSIAVLARLVEDGRTTIGAHLHPWVNPPFDEPMTPANSYAGNLPRALEGAKLDVLGGAIAAAFGTAPKIYRAGRYGLGPNTLSLLAERGYAIDSSMRSGYCYAAEGGPDFGAIGNAAFVGGEGVTEVPLTTIYTGAWRRGGTGLHRRLGALPKGRGIAARLGLLNRVSLSPEDMPLAEALAAIGVALDQGLRLLNFSFHSPTIVPGHTPYGRTPEDVAGFYRWWDAVLALLAARGVRPASGDDLLAATRIPALAGNTRHGLGGAGGL